jgi:Flp pilus assembly protein TadG
VSRRFAAGLLRRFRQDSRGVALVEFALIFPMLVALYFGGFEVCNMTATYRKLTDTTVEVANVTAQYPTLAAADVATIFAATSQIMAPYPTTSLQIVLSEVTTDASSNATVTWSQSYNGATALAIGSAVTLPTGLAAPSSNYILVQTVYNYTPTVGSTFVSAVPMTSSIYIIPRNSPSIPYTG